MGTSGNLGIGIGGPGTGRGAWKPHAIFAPSGGIFPTVVGGVVEDDLMLIFLFFFVFRFPLFIAGASYCKHFVWRGVTVPFHGP
jgi:hypothetical protein